MYINLLLLLAPCIELGLLSLGPKRHQPSLQSLGQHLRPKQGIRADQLHHWKHLQSAPRAKEKGQQPAKDQQQERAWRPQRLVSVRFYDDLLFHVSQQHILVHYRETRHGCARNQCIDRGRQPATSQLIDITWSHQLWGHCDKGARWYR